jgi:putative methyltransferase (TIGR04325 family)
MTPIKSLVKDWLPPAILRAIRYRRGGSIRFEGDYATWQEAAAQCTGYDAESILAKVLEATLQVKRGDAVYERDSVLFDEIDYAWPVTAGLMWAAAQSGGRLDVLDFGGALGSSYFQNRALLAGLPQVRWSVVEQEHFVDAGKQHIQDETLRFYSTIDACLAENKPNVVLLSSVLQYLPNIEVVIAEINYSGILMLIIDRTPFNNKQNNEICIQKVPESIYRGSYPMWIFSQDRLNDVFDDWEFVAKSRSPEGSLISASGLLVDFRGLILKRKNAH